MRKLTHAEIVARQMANLDQPGMPITVVLNNIRSLYNVGSIFRTADGAGVERIWLCGITGYPPQAQLSKTALGAEDRVSWDHSDDALIVVRDLKARGYQIVLLEQAEGSVEYDKFVPENPVCLVIGNEITGVSAELLSLCDAVIEIEMGGIKNSLNVAVAFGIVVYRLRQCLKKSNLKEEHALLMNDC